MTEPTAPAPVENVSRGLAVAALSIPAAIIGFALIAGLLGGIGGFVAIVVPILAAWLYAKGAGAPLSRAGLVPLVAIAAVALVLGVITGLIAAAYNAFTAVGGDGGLTSPAFWTTVRNVFGNMDALFPVLIGFALGIVGIATVVRNARAVSAGTATPAVAPAAPYAQTTPNAPVPPATAVNPAPPAPNTPSPGIILNGEPLDPNAKK